jgi:acyl-CoA thioesterase FadM
MNPKTVPVREAGSFGPSLRVPKARILSVRRADPSRISVGDWAEAELSPEVLQFFSLKDPQGRAWCEGYASEWTLPIAVAADAAYAVLEPVSCPGLNTFSGITKSFQWKRRWQPDENLIAVTRLLGVGHTSATVEYRTISKERKDLILEGTEVFVAVSGNPPKPVPIRLSPDTEASPVRPQENPPSTEPGAGTSPLSGTNNRPGDFFEEMETGTSRYCELPEAPPPDIFRLRPTQLLSKSVSNPNHASEGDVWEWLVPADLLRLLGNPIAGNREVLGRRLHPYGLLSVAIPIRAAQHLFGPAARPFAATIRYFRPVNADSDFKHRMTLRSVLEKELILDSELQQDECRAAVLTLTLEASS